MQIFGDRELVFDRIEAVPDADELAALAVQCVKLTVKLPTRLASHSRYSQYEPTRFLRALKDALLLRLPGNRAVSIGSYLRGDAPQERDEAGTLASWSALTVYTTLTEERILPHANAIVAAARDQDALATDLMVRLAHQLGDVPEPFAADAGHWPRHKQTGRLETLPDWDYYFHGCDCAFGNRVTRQVVQAGQGNANVTGHGFGMLNPYFFGDFCRSTPAHANLRLGNWERVVEVLARHGYLLEVMIQQGWDSGFVVPPAPSG